MMESHASKHQSNITAIEVKHQWIAFYDPITTCIV